MLSIWMTSWSWFALSGRVRGLTHSCVPYWLALDFILIFPSLTFTSLRPFVSWGYIGILSMNMLVSLPSDKLADIQQLALSLLHTLPVTVCRVMSFLDKANFCANGYFQLQRLCHVI